jgi:outer membrane protein OmpA-like peptidoglycan-associated protein
MKLRTALIFTVDVMFGLSAWAQNPPKWEVPVDYSYVHYQAIDFESRNGAYFFGQNYNLNGGGGGIVYNFTHLIGFKAEFQGYGSENRVITIPAGNPFLPAGGSASVQGNLFTYLFGPQIKIYKGRFHPFAEGLVGGAHSNVYKNAINTLNLTGISKAPSNDTFAAAAGLGFDIALNQRVSIRPFEMDYLYTNFNGNAGLTANQNSWRYLGGAVFTWGGKPPIPPTASCSVTPTEIWSGDPVTATISTLNFNPKHTVTYSWTSTGGKISGTSTTGNIDTTGIAPGSYTVSGTATDAKEKKNNTANCSASFTVRTPRPPTASCSASPETIKPGDAFTVTVAAQSPDNSPLTYSYTTSSGSITGTGANASETTSGANAGSTITATANVVDARGLSTTCTASVTVQPFPVVAAKPEVISAGECTFNQSNKPGRVDNQCKAVLDEVALQVQRQPNGKVVVVGYTDETETVKMTQLAGQRAVNVKYYLTSGEGGAGIDASRIEARSGTVKEKGAKIYIVPEGATFTEESTAVDETTVKGQPRNAPAKKSKKASN